MYILCHRPLSSLAPSSFFGRVDGHDAHDPSIVTCDSGGNNDDDNDGDDDGDGQGGGGNGDDDERGRYPDLSTARDPCDPARDPS